MNRYPAPRSVLVADNCSIHKSQHLRDLCHENGVRLEFLSPYSPDYNPVSSSHPFSNLFRNNHIFQIEQCFHYIKAYLRRHREWVESLEDPVDGIEAACMSVDRGHARASFRRAGYLPIWDRIQNSCRLFSQREIIAVALYPQPSAGKMSNGTKYSLRSMPNIIPAPRAQIPIHLQLRPKIMRL